MDQLLCASLSQTHYRYEAGMLKVPDASTRTPRGATVPRSSSGFFRVVKYKIKVLSEGYKHPTLVFSVFVKNRAGKDTYNPDKCVQHFQ